jgi:phage FluMu gp28-like protein
MNAPLSKEEWLKLRSETVAQIDDIAEQVGLPNVLLGYQSKAVGLLDSTALQVLFIEKSRRIGMTWALAAAAVLRSGRDKPSGGMDAMYISYSQEMTREFIDACAMWSRAFSMVAIDTQEFLFEDTNVNDPTDTKQIQAFRIRFASGFEIMALSSAPRTLRGKQGIVIIDEAAFVDNLKELLKAAMAFLMWGGKVIVCSTHDGTENDFNQEIQSILSERSKYDHLRVDLDDALQDGLYERICLVTGKEWTPEGEAEWRNDLIGHYGDASDEELYCIPSQGSGTWLSTPLIEARMTAEGEKLTLDLPPNFLQMSGLERMQLIEPFMRELETRLEALDLSLRFAFGFDFARVADLTVGTLLAIQKNLHRTEALTFELRGVPGDEQKMIVKTVLKHVQQRLVGAAFDATGMGWTVAEDMGRIFGFRENEDDSGLIWAIKFSQEWYRLNMPPLKTAFEDAAISLQKDDDHVSDLRLVKLTRGIPMVPQVREGAKGKKRHGDFAIGLALAHFASRMRWVEYNYEAVVTGQPNVGDQRRSGRGFDYPDTSDDYAGKSNSMRSPLGALIRGGGI